MYKGAAQNAEVDGLPQGESIEAEYLALERF